MYRVIRVAKILSCERTGIFSERWKLVVCGPSGSRKGATGKLGRIEMGTLAKKNVARMHLPSWVDGKFLDEIVTTGIGVINGEQLQYLAAAAATISA